MGKSVVQTDVMSGGHVEAVHAQGVDGEATSRPALVAAPSSEQLVEDTFAQDITLYDVLVSAAREDHEASAEDHDRADGNWHPSSLGQCDRAAVLEHAGREKNPVTDQTLLYFWLGHIIHDAVQKRISLNLPGQVWHECVIEDEEFMVIGHLDSLRMVRLPDDTYEVFFEVYEYKTVRTNAFNFPMPYKSHVLQVALYLTFPARCPAEGTVGLGALHDPSCGVCGGRGVLPLPRRARIAYIGKEDGQLKTFIVRNTPELREEVYMKLRSLQKQYKAYELEGKLPDKLGKVPVLIKGVEQVYKRGNSKKGIKAGDPKLEDDHRTRNCDYKGQGVCCADQGSA